MKKNIIIFSVLIAVLAVGLWFWVSNEQAKKAPATTVTSDIILFYGEECPHCKDVEKFLEENKISEKIKFDSLEVWHNNANKQVFLQKVRECGLAQDSAGVPLLYARGECAIGTPDVKIFFQQEFGKQ